MEGLVSDSFTSGTTLILRQGTQFMDKLGSTAIDLRQALSTNVYVAGLQLLSVPPHPPAHLSLETYNL